MLKLRRLELKGAVEEKASQKFIKKSNEMKWKDNNLWLSMIPIVYQAN
jgi:hypothetical protein